MRVVKKYPMLVFDDGFNRAEIFYPDSIKLSNNEVITALTAARRVERKFQPFTWLNKKWVRRKTVDRNKVELQSNNPNSNLDGLTIEIEK